MQRFKAMYSHLPNKRDVTLTNFRKFHPARNKNPPCMFISLQNFQYSYRTFNILTRPNDDISHGHFEPNLYSSPKIDGKSPVDFATFVPLHVHCNLHGY